MIKKRKQAGSSVNNLPFSHAPIIHAALPSFNHKYGSRNFRILTNQQTN